MKLAHIKLKPDQFDDSSSMGNSEAFATLMHDLHDVAKGMALPRWTTKEKALKDIRTQIRNLLDPSMISHEGLWFRVYDEYEDHTGMEVLESTIITLCFNCEVTFEAKYKNFSLEAWEKITDGEIGWCDQCGCAVTTQD